MGKFKQALEPQKSRKEDPLVTLTVKVPVSHRRYWQVKAKERGLSVSAIAVAALVKEFGLPSPEEH